MTPIGLYLALVVAVAVQRLWETGRSKRNVAALLARGAEEHGAGHFPVMVALHGSWLVACAAEAWFAVPEPPPTVLWVGALIVLAVGQALRLLAMRALGERWTARVIVLPGAPLVEHGLFRWIRHPNYVGVILEIAALPLVYGAWRGALAFSIANALLLRHRIAVEEEALGG